MSNTRHESTNVSECESQPLLEDSGPPQQTDARPNFTLRALIVGMLVGILINLSNTHYGLVAGSSAQMPTVSVLVGHLAFLLPSRMGFDALTKAETVLLTSAATATGCMTVTAGFAEFIPGIEYILGPKDGGPMHLNWAEMFVWALGLCFFGIVFAAMLRKPLVAGPGLPWPGARATSNVIVALHASESKLRIDDTASEEPLITDGHSDDDHTRALKKLRLIVRSAAWSGLLVCTPAG